MREIVYKNLTSANSRKKDIFLQEIFEKDGVTAKTERRYFYFVKDIINLGQPDDFQKWVTSHGAVGIADKRQFHIFKWHSDAKGEDRVICKILGNFYAVVNNAIYTIAFLHSFKIRFSKGTLAK